MTIRISAIALSAGLAAFAALPAQAASGTDAFANYHELRSVPVKSGGFDWDYLVFQSGANRLFAGHRDAGLEVFDVDHGFKMTTVPDTKMSDGAVLMPEDDLGVSAENTGKLTFFKLSTLKPVKTVTVGKELDYAGYDPVSKRLVALNANKTKDGKGQTMPVFSIPSLKKAGSIRIASTSLDHPVVDGKGNMFMTGQDTNTVFRVNMKTMKVTANWPTSCTQPVGLAIDTGTQRLMIACRGHLTAPKAPPRFEVMNATNGKQVFTAPISADNDGVAFDPKTKLIFVADGIGANMFIFHEDSADAYRLNEVMYTTPYQRTLTIDPKTGNIYTDAAEGLVDPTKKILVQVSPYYPNSYVPNSFRIYQYGK